MKTEIKHCRHFDPVIMMRKDRCRKRHGCPTTSRTPCHDRLMDCLNITHNCDEYED
jgi:hypothetical protein